MILPPSLSLSCSDPVIALRAIALEADGLGWLGRWLVLVLGRLEGLLLALRGGVLVVAPEQIVGVGGFDLPPVVGVRTVRLAVRSRSGLARVLVGAEVGVVEARHCDDVVPGWDWWSVDFKILALGWAGLAVRVAVFSIGGLGLRKNCDSIVPVC